MCRDEEEVVPLPIKVGTSNLFIIIACKGSTSASLHSSALQMLNLFRLNLKLVLFRMICSFGRVDNLNNNLTNPFNMLQYRQM